MQQPRRVAARDDATDVVFDIKVFDVSLYPPNARAPAAVAYMGTRCGMRVSVCVTCELKRQALTIS